MSSNEYEVLKRESLMLIGERFPGRIIWVQKYDTSDNFSEEDIKNLSVAINKDVQKDKIPSGSARKFYDGKLIYYEHLANPEEIRKTRVFAIFTRQLSINNIVKRAVQIIATRSGVYSARRFFTEMIDLVENPEKIDFYDQLSLEKAIERVQKDDFVGLSINELGYLITFVNQSSVIDLNALEKIYFHLYEIIESIQDQDDENDPDEFIDAAYVIAQKYREIDSFHLALELFKKIIPIAESNHRYDLEVACRIQIALIYRDFFPEYGQYILEILEPIGAQHREETNNKLLERYYCLLGIAYLEQGQFQLAYTNFKIAIDVGDQEINDPFWVAIAYKYLAILDEKRHRLKDAIRHYLTAATLAFTAGDLALVDEYRNLAAKAELHVANSAMHAALIFLMEEDYKEAEFRAWEALRLLVKSYIHSKLEDVVSLKQLTEEILSHAKIVLQPQLVFDSSMLLSGPKAPPVLQIKEKSNEDKFEHNKDFLEKMNTISKKIQSGDLDGENIEDILQKLGKEVEENIPLPPPTFMLLTLDGRLMTMGRIEDNGWERSELKGSLLSGFLSAIMSILTEVTDNTSSLRTVDAGNTQIMIEQSENFIAALLVDRDIPEFRIRLISLLNYIDFNFGDQLRFWNGNINIFEPVKYEAQKLLAPSIVAANIDQYD